MDLQAQLEKVQPVHGIELGPDCLCPPVCFQCPPPFCLPCGPGPGGALPDGTADSMPAPRQCGPFLMLNTPMERSIVMLPMMSPNGNGNGNGNGFKESRPSGTKNGDRHRGHRRNNVDCCDEDHHHHHHGSDGDEECCEEKHHHHHHDDEECSMKRPKAAKGRKRGDDDDDGCPVPKTQQKSDRNGRSKTRSLGSARTNSRELRGGKLLIGCDCEKRNGLQDECQRSLCMGSPECVTIPPTCPPSRFSNGKHLTKLRGEQERKLREAFKYC